MVWSRLWHRGWFSFEGWPARTVWRESVLGSSRVFLGGFAGYLGNRLDNLLVAGAMGPTVMSYYSMAWNASRTPTGTIAKAITFVLIPTFARMQNETERVERGLKECLEVSYMALAPVCALMLVCAPDLVTTVLGPKWMPIVPALRLMSVTVLVGPLVEASNALLVGTGRAQLSVVAGVVRVVVLLILMQPLAGRWGLSGAVWGDLISSLVSAIALFAVVQAAVRKVRWPLASALACPVLAAFCAGALSWRLGSHLDAGYVRLACQAGILSGSYPLIFAALGGKASLVSLGALMRSALVRRIPVAE
jgi:O-antigen/teichoic acid export membrane protein